MDAWAYPIVICFLGTLAMLLFKSEVKGLLNRAEKISPTGIETGKVVTQITDSAEKSDVVSSLTNHSDKSDIETALHELDDPLVHQIEAQIEKSICEKYSKPEEREKVLLRLFAGLLMTHDFEQIYKTIFGSQLSLLELLNSNSNGLISDVAKSIYNFSKEANPVVYNEYAFGNWLNYLVSQGLILIDAEGKIILTVKGKAFLLFLVKSGYTKIKPY
jgi:hypothetical protein